MTSKQERIAAAWAGAITAATFCFALALNAVIRRIESTALIYLVTVVGSATVGIVAGLMWLALMRRWWNEP